jgi:tRNA A-37 threonylcarbamoyl transferase component Bud32
VHDEGTYLEINSTSSHSCKVKCENMSAYVKQFASKVYQQHSLAPFPPDNRLKYDQFANWVQEDKKLYKSFFSSFHTEIWTNDDGEPRYLTSKADLEFVGRIECGKIRGEVYGFQIKDMIVFCESAKTKGKAIKIVCLEGLTITDLGNLSLEIAHRSDHYRNCVMVFRRAEEHEEWMVSLRRYQKESLNLNYMIGEVIGTGKFSTVYKCTNKNSNKVFALKAIDLRKLSKKAVDAIRNESEILKIINHPQVLKYHETINTKTHEYIITEYIYGEDLFEYVRKRSRLNEFESAFIIGNIMKAVIYLHELDIMHRDLKPENIMIMFKEIREGEYFECTSAHIRKGQRIENIKIIDFGISDHLSDLAKIEKTKLLAGTPNYIAPEIILGEPLTLKSDIFAIGSILYFMYGCLNPGSRALSPSQNATQKKHSSTLLPAVAISKASIGITSAAKPNRSSEGCWQWTPLNALS